MYGASIFARPLGNGDIMKIEPSNEGQPRIFVEIDETEASHLLSILLHAKFSDDVRLTIVGSPTMQGLLRGLLEARKSLGFDRHERSGWATIREEEGTSAPPSFSLIEQELQDLLGKEDVTDELSESLFPYTWIRRNSKAVTQE
jgi:hypothetical protein